MIEQRQALGGPLDGRILQIESPAPHELPIEGGKYVRTRFSMGVILYTFIPAVDRWSPRKRSARWGVPKRPFHRVESSRWGLSGPQHGDDGTPL